LGLQAKLLQKLFDRQAMVGGDAFEDSREGSGLDRMMVRNNLMIFAILLRGYSGVGTFLPGHRVTKDAQRSGQLRSVNIAG
jgi:hypothetical protein